MDTDTYLMLAIFQRALGSVGDADPNVSEFAATRKLDIAEAGKVLVYLGLATPDAGCALGWQLTRVFAEIVADRLSQRKPPVEHSDDELTVHLLRDAVFGNGGEGKGQLGFKLLLQLELLQVTDAGGWAATPRLRELFEEGYYRQYLEKTIKKHERLAAAE
jgi:hypothetical protein